MTLFQQVLIKVGALFSYCGGPLILIDVLKPRFGTPVAFGATFAPIVLMIFGADSLCYPSPKRRDPARGLVDRDEPESLDMPGWGILTVRLGLVGALMTLLMHAYGAWLLATTPPRPDQALYAFGIAVGIPLAGIYGYLARRWLSRIGGPEDVRSPIEPR